MAKIIQGKFYIKKSIKLDDKHFVDCFFDNCYLVYEGRGKAPKFEKCQFENMRGLHYAKQAKEMVRAMLAVKNHPDLKEVFIHPDYPPKDYPFA